MRDSKAIVAELTKSLVFISNGSNAFLEGNIVEENAMDGVAIDGTGTTATLTKNHFKKQTKELEYLLAVVQSLLLKINFVKDPKDGIYVMNQATNAG